MIRILMASSSSLALSTLLSTLHTHLNAQTQLLPQLHSQLGLPATALEDELQELQLNLTRAVESQIDVRKKQVEEWEVRCEEVEIACSRYARALGTNAKVAGSLNEIKSEKVLPRRHERAIEHHERLRQVCRRTLLMRGCVMLTLGIGLPHEARTANDIDKSAEHPRAKFGFELFYR